MSSFERIDELHATAQAEYKQISAEIDAMFGWLTHHDAAYLYNFAANGPGEGFIVEIGSMMGRSTSVLAHASKSKGREKVVAIDHFEGSVEHQPGQGFQVDDIVKFGTTYMSFKKNLASLGVKDHVIPIAGSSEEANAIWNKPIRLLYIDASHDYENVKKDFEIWSPFVCPGGLVVFDDAYNPEDGPGKLCAEIDASNQEFEKVMHAYQCVFQRKV